MPDGFSIDIDSNRIFIMRVVIIRNYFGLGEHIKAFSTPIAANLRQYRLIERYSNNNNIEPTKCYWSFAGIGRIVVNRWFELGLIIFNRITSGIPTEQIQYLF
jgi:hypothetical protein